ncbi:hypothetical protein C8R47DRAFT_1090117 [Mycena vitilis]|nr:hypothetical protein C8R47DRAFT_1090117 [Mycena vitilis]
MGEFEPLLWRSSGRIASSLIQDLGPQRNPSSRQLPSKHPGKRCKCLHASRKPAGRVLLVGRFLHRRSLFHARRALRMLKAIREEEPAGKTTVSMAEWLKMHRGRTIIADLPSFICFTIAAGLAL